MEAISEELVEETWREFAGFSTARAEKEMIKISKNQPNLLAFMMEFTQELNQDAKGLAIYMFCIIYRMFQKGSKTEIKRVSPKKIVKCYNDNKKFIKSLEGVDDKFFERIAGLQFSEQPFVMKYLVETLIEAPEEEDSVPLNEQDTGTLFLLLKTVIDLLDRS